MKLLKGFIKLYLEIFTGLIAHVIYAIIYIPLFITLYTNERTGFLKINNRLPMFFSNPFPVESLGLSLGLQGRIHIKASWTPLKAWSIILVHLEKEKKG